MTKVFFLVLILITSSASYSQLPNQNTYLIANIDNYAAYSALWGYTADNGRQYAILGCDTGTSFVDVTDSSNIHEVDFIGGVFGIYREMKTYSHYAYVVSEGTNSRLQIIDLQNLPDSVSLVKTFSYSGYTRTHAISQSGPYLYLNGGDASPNGGIKILDVTDPILPLTKGSYSSLYVHDCRVRNDTLWACNILNRKVSVINALDKDNPQEIRSFTTLQSMPHNCALSKDGDFLYVAHENFDPGKLSIWNVQDLSNITFVGNWQPTGITTSPIHNIEVYDTFAIAAHYTAGIRILNISNPGNPVEVAWYDTRPEDNSDIFEGCWAVYKFPDNKIIASDISNGLFVIKTTIMTGGVNSNSSSSGAPEKFSLNQNYPNPFNPVTNLEFEIPDLGFVSLKVYDILGNEVKTVVNSKLNPGRYKYDFDANLLPSGIYFYTLKLNSLLEPGELSETKKMLLLK